MKTVAIIGAGITGLVAGYRLMQRGLPVTIYEAGPRAGGVIETTSRDGFLAESGPNTIVEISPLIGELVRDLGLDADKIYSAPEAGNRYAVRNGRMVRMPATGSEFAVLPADNATGNFVKIAQRIPVKIAIDADQPLKARLHPGMSVEVRIDTSDARRDARH